MIAQEFQQQTLEMLTELRRGQLEQAVQLGTVTGELSMVRAEQKEHRDHDARLFEKLEGRVGELADRTGRYDVVAETAASRRGTWMPIVIGVIAAVASAVATTGLHHMAWR